MYSDQALRAGMKAWNILSSTLDSKEDQLIYNDTAQFKILYDEVIQRLLEDEKTEA